MTGPRALYREMWDSAVTYRPVLATWTTPDGNHYALLDCQHPTSGSKVNKLEVGQMGYCDECSTAKRVALGLLERVR